MSRGTHDKKIYIYITKYFSPPIKNQIGFKVTLLQKIYITGTLDIFSCNYYLPQMNLQNLPGRRNGIAEEESAGASV